MGSADVRFDPAIAGLARVVEVALARVGLTLQQYRVLAHLGGDTASASELADRLSVKPPTVTKLVDGMVERSLVRRARDGRDRRRSAHCLTPTGKRLLTRANNEIQRTLGVLAADLDADERAVAVEGMRLWGVAMGRRWHRIHGEGTG